MQIKVNITTVDGEVLEIFTVESHPAVGTPKELLAAQVRDLIEHRFNVLDDADAALSKAAA